MTTWKKTTEAKYWEMLECLPPAAHSGFGFLVGEPVDHTSDGHPRFEAFVEPVYGELFESVEPITIAEFKALKMADIKEAA